MLEPVYDFFSAIVDLRDRQQGLKKQLDKAGEKGSNKLEKLATDQDPAPRRGLEIQSSVVNF